MNNEQEFNAKESANELIKEFKNWMKELGFDVDEFSEEQYKLLKLMSIHDLFMHQLQIQQQHMEELQKNKAKQEKANAGKKIFVPDDADKEGNIIQLNK